MDSTHLTPEQIARLAAALSGHLRYLNRLCARMQVLRFPPDDPLSRSAHVARDALQDVYTCALGRCADQRMRDAK